MTLAIRTTDCAAEPPRSRPLKPSWNTLYTRVVVDLDGPPCVAASMMPKVSKKAYTRFTTKRKNEVGDSSGKAMVRKRFTGPAPSIAAASIIDFGIDCRPARKNRKL